MSETPTGAGAPLPDPRLPTLAGEDFRFADLRGVKLLLFMWGSW